MDSKTQDIIDTVANSIKKITSRTIGESSIKTISTTIQGNLDTRFIYKFFNYIRKLLHKSQIIYLKDIKISHMVNKHD